MPEFTPCSVKLGPAEYAEQSHFPMEADAGRNRGPERLGLSHLTMAGVMVVREQENLQC
jgi:hypothetical protein